MSTSNYWARITITTNSTWNQEALCFNAHILQETSKGNIVWHSAKHSNILCDSNDENDFAHKLLITNTSISKLRNAFPNNSSTNIKLSKTQLHKIWQWGGFLGRLSGTLQKIGLPLIENVLKPLAKSFSIPLGLTAAASATDAAIYNKMFGSRTATLIISYEEINDIMKIVKAPEESGLLIKDVRETIKNEAK